MGEILFPCKPPPNCTHNPQPPPSNYITHFVSSHPRSRCNHGNSGSQRRLASFTISAKLSAATKTRHVFPTNMHHHLCPYWCCHLAHSLRYWHEPLSNPTPHNSKTPPLVFGWFMESTASLTFTPSSDKLIDQIK